MVIHWSTHRTRRKQQFGFSSVIVAEDQTLLKVPSNILCSLKLLTISRCVDLEFYGGNGGFGGFTTLEKLHIDDCPKLGSLLVSGTNDDDTSDMDVGLLLPPSLKKLAIYGCPKLAPLLARDTKDDTGNMDVGLLSPSLEAISLSNLPENLQSYFLKGLAYLKELRLRDSPHLKCVQLHSCTALEELQIWKCEQLGVLEGLQFFTSLRFLQILECQQLGALEGLQFLTSLQSLTISSCQQLAALEGLQFLTSLQSLTISSCQQLAALGGLEFLSSLQSLEIEMNSELSAAWDRDPKLQELEQGGNQVGMLPLSITRLEISNLTNNVQSRLLSCLPAMTNLVIGESPELTSLQLGYCTALTKLEFRDCESLASIEGLQFNTNLTSLTIAASSSLPPWMELLLQQQGACEVLSRLITLKIVGDASVLTMSLCKQLISLRRLQFNGQETSSMVSLTEEQERALHLLTSLRELWFWGYPNLLLLPADLRSLVSLKELSIWLCPSISGRLPEMDTSCELDVYNCSEELSQRCKEWGERRREMIGDETVEY